MFDSIIISRSGKVRVAKEKFYGVKKLIKKLECQRSCYSHLKDNWNKEQF